MSKQRLWEKKTCKTPEILLYVVTAVIVRDYGSVKEDQVQRGKIKLIWAHWIGFDLRHQTTAANMKLGIKTYQMVSVKIQWSQYMSTLSYGKLHNAEMGYVSDMEIWYLFWRSENWKFSHVWEFPWEYSKAESKGIEAKVTIAGSMHVILYQKLIYENRVQGGTKNVQDNMTDRSCSFGIMKWFVTRATVQE